MTVLKEMLLPFLVLPLPRTSTCECGIGFSAFAVEATGEFGNSISGFRLNLKTHFSEHRPLKSVVTTIILEFGCF